MVRASIAIGRVSVPWQDDFCAHRLGPCNRCVDVVNLEPKKQAVARRHVGGITDGSVMMFHFLAVQLHHQLAGINEAFVIRPAMCALAMEQPLIPTATRFNILHANQRLWSYSVSPGSSSSL